MTDQLRFLRLEEQIQQLNGIVLPHLNQFQLMQQKISTLDVFITSNPRVDLISDTIDLLNKQLKIQERLSAIESQHSKFSNHYDEVLNRHSLYIMQIQPWIDEMHKILEEAKQNREMNQQMRLNFKEISQKHKEYTGILLQNDRLTQHYKTRLDQFETQLTSKIDHSEITKVQDLMRRDFVTCLELDDIRTQITQKIDRLQSDTCTKQQFGALQDTLKFMTDRQQVILTELVDKKVDDLANQKLKIYATKNDQRVFEDRINQICKILSDKTLTVQKEIQEEIKLLNEIVKEQNQKLNDFKQQIQLINSTFQKVVMKDELQQAMQKTLRLQRESEYLNEKLESISAEIFEQKVSFQAFNKQKNVEIQNLQHQLVQKEGESVTYESPRRTDNDYESPELSPRKKIKKSIVLQRQGSFINSDMMQRIFQRSDARIQELQNQLDEMRQRLPKNSKFQEQQQIMPVSDTINIRMEYFNQMIIQLVDETKKFKLQFDLLEQQIQAIQNKPQIKEEQIQQIDQKLKWIQELEFKLEQKCDSSLVIPILDSKANAQEFSEVRILSKQMKQCLFDTISSLRSFFSSDQNDQIKDLLLNQLNRYLMYFVKVQEVTSDTQNNASTAKYLHPKYTATRMKSHSSCSKRRETECEIRGRSVNKTETAVYNSLRSSPLAFRLVNQNRQSATIVKRMKVQ